MNSEQILKELNGYIIVGKPNDTREITKIWIEFDKEGETTGKTAYNDYIDQRVDGLVKQLIEEQKKDLLVKINELKTCKKDYLLNGEHVEYVRKDQVIDILNKHE